MATTQLWFALGTIGMALGSVGLLAGVWRLDRETWRTNAILVAVPAIAVAAYALMALDVGAVTSAVGGTVFVPRYVDWLLTTPLHILYLGLFAGATTGALARAGGLQALTILLGLAGALVGVPLKWGFYVAGLLAFGAVVYYVFRDFDSAARTRGGSTLALFRKLRAFLVVLWLVYPLIWVLGPNAVGLMDVETTALVVSYIDIVSKVGFGLIAINGQVVFADTVTSRETPAD
jgi:sensory rhodopsin